MATTAKCLEAVDDDEENSVGAVLLRPQLPDLIIHQIIPLLPTKSAIRMNFLSKQFEADWYNQPVIDFDEDENGERRRSGFMYMVHRYLNHHILNDENSNQLKALDKLRLRMTIFSNGKGTSMVNKLLSLAVRRSVKEVEISVPGYDCLTKKSPLNFAETITMLKLEDLDSHP